MGLKIVTAPVEEPITLAQAKAHLRVDFDDDNELIGALIKAARQQAEKFLGRALIEQTLDYTLDEFPTDGIVHIPRPPLLEVVGVFYQSGGGTEEEVSSASYVVSGIGCVDVGGKVAPIATGSWPTSQTVPEAVRIRFRAGYLDETQSPAVSTVPEDIIAAIKLTVGTFYANRETIVVGQSVTQLPWAAEQLLRQHRFEKSLA